jgi:nitrogen fixation NifU-like protein
VIDHATDPRNVGVIPNADGFGHVMRSCGDIIEICLAVRNDTIVNATFWTNGCGPVIACSSMITELVRGMQVTEAQQIQREDLVEALDGLPEDDEHCAVLAVSALKAALTDYLALQREPWKKAYRNPR